MNNFIKTAMLLWATTFAACGDDERPAVDAPKPLIDAPPDMMADALVFPAAPTLGMQIDRMGRPAVNTALNALLDASALKMAKKNAYNQAVNANFMTVIDPAATPPTTIRAEFFKYLALFDVVDQGSTLVGEGCGNGALYNATPNTGYATLATVLANDELYLDTAKTSCLVYLSVEVGLLAGTHTQCGGRTLTHDVIDSSYSLLAAGVNGFNAQFQGLVQDGVAAHTDVNLTTFPFLGAPR